MPSVSDFVMLSIAGICPLVHDTTRQFGRSHSKSDGAGCDATPTIERKWIGR